MGGWHWKQAGPPVSLQEKENKETLSLLKGERIGFSYEQSKKGRAGDSLAGEDEIEDKRFADIIYEGVTAWLVLKMDRLRSAILGNGFDLGNVAMCDVALVLLVLLCCFVSLLTADIELLLVLQKGG